MRHPHLNAASLGMAMPHKRDSLGRPPLICEIKNLRFSAVPASFCCPGRSKGGCSFVGGFCYLCRNLPAFTAQRTISFMKLKPSLFPVILLFAVLATQLLPGCAPLPERSRLEQIEAIIDEHPDSAMALIDSIDTTALRTIISTRLNSLHRSMPTPAATRI